MEQTKNLKPYTSPKMEVVEIKHQEPLMQYSGTISLHEFEKDYKA